MFLISQFSHMRETSKKLKSDCGELTVGEQKEG